MKLTPRQRRLTYTIEEAANLLGISRTHAYSLAARDGGLPCRVLRLGTRLVVPRADLDRCLGMDGGGEEVDTAQTG